MLKLYSNKAVLHSLVWLMIYLILNTITGNIASSISIEPYIVGAFPNLLLAVVCLFYLKKSKISGEIGLFTKPTEKSSTMLFYIPVLILPFLNLFYGVNKELSATKILALLAMYTGVGFMEEIIFRGLMFKALTHKWNRYVVVSFISFTFAMGHIVSIVAIGQSAGDTMLQIINAFVVGFMFIAVILASGNLTICIITHILYNFMAGISRIDSTHTQIIIANLIITAIYFIYLLLYAKNVKEYFKSLDLS
ncbi:MAG: CPBP family intramembrane metalloprotease [Eubacteriales bacterium]|nr:CPBP family intramembrane metalloprotease [Eubacteriales bacterium]